MQGVKLLSSIKYSEEQLNNLVKFNKSDVFLWKKRVDNYWHIGTHWLNIQPLFYNLEKKIFSTKLFSSISNDGVGLELYKTFGYLSLGKTLDKSISFLLADEVLVVNNEAGLIKVISKDDYAIKVIKSIRRKSITISELNMKIKQKLELYADKRIILPLSGGYDSTYLASLTKDFQDIQCFTYAQSSIRILDRESRIAKANAKKLGLRWNKIYLTYSKIYLNIWRKLYKYVTHDHGMYHIEFYELIRKMNNPKDTIVLSGIVGDAWSGKLDTTENPINNIADSINLFLSHEYSLMDFNQWSELTNEFFKQKIVSHEDLLNCEEGRIIFLVRNKMMLLNYMMKSTFLADFNFVTPFLCSEVIKEVFSVKKWKDRVWQKEYFSFNGLKVDSKSLIGTSNAQFVRELYMRDEISNFQLVWVLFLLTFRIDKIYKIRLKDYLIKLKFNWRQ